VRSGLSVGDGGGGGDGDAPVGAAVAPGRAAGGEVLRGGARLQRQRLLVLVPMGRAPVGAAQARAHAHP
jgi:hypothetical protein